MIVRIALSALAVAFIIAEAVRPTTIHPKKIASHALLVATQDAAAPRSATLDPELLDDLPRIRPDAPTTIARSGDDTISGTIVDPYTRLPGLAVFPIVAETRVTDFAASYRNGRYVIRLVPELRAHTHSVAVGLVASDQRGYFRSVRSLALPAP